MALVVIIMSGIVGMFTALVGFLGFDFTLAQAVALYLVSSIVPVALVMAGFYLHMQITRVMTTHDTLAEANRIRR